RPIAILQPLHTFGCVPMPPFVTRLPADPSFRAQTRHHRPFFLRRHHKPQAFFHDAGLSPRHRQILPPTIENLSTMYPVPFVRDVSGPYPLLASPPSGGEERELIPACTLLARRLLVS